MFFERRQTLRVRPTAREPIEVQFVASGMLEIVQAVDISERGIAVRLEARFGRDLIGMDVELVITIPNSFPVYTKGVVRRVSAGDGYVIGIKFVGLSAKAVEAIQTYIQRRMDSHSSSKIRLSG